MSAIEGTGRSGPTQPDVMGRLEEETWTAARPNGLRHLTLSVTVPQGALKLAAPGSTDADIAAQRVLASLQFVLQEGKRPGNEPRHLDPNNGLPWTKAPFV